MTSGAESTGSVGVEPSPAKTYEAPTCYNSIMALVANLRACPLCGFEFVVDEKIVELNHMCTYRLYYHFLLNHIPPEETARLRRHIEELITSIAMRETDFRGNSG